MKSSLLSQVVYVLNRAGFVTSRICDIRPKSFDLAARREQLLLLLKVLYNIDGLTEEVANEVKRLASHLLGSPLIVGEKSGDHPLEDGVVYRRFGIPSINLPTLYDYFVEEVPPYVYAAPGGFYVSIDGKILREERLKKKMSLGDLASACGISRRAISKYEEGKMDATVENALKLEEILGIQLINPISITLPEFEEIPVDIGELSYPELDILKMMEEIGFEVFPTTHSPFSAVSQDEKTTILTGTGRYTESMVKRAKIMSSISIVAQTKSVYIVEGNAKRTQIEDTVLIKKGELEKVDDSEEFISLMEEKSRSGRFI
ncbi:MAG: transcriptional regulator [Candidatus Syntropharchaeia archaeon]